MPLAIGPLRSAAAPGIRRRALRRNATRGPHGLRRSGLQLPAALAAFSPRVHNRLDLWPPV